MGKNLLELATKLRVSERESESEREEWRQKQIIPHQYK